MNYTLSQLRDRVNQMIEQQGEDAHCAAWIFTAENCIVYYEDTKEYHFVAEGNPELAERILTNVSDDDHICQRVNGASLFSMDKRRTWVHSTLEFL